MDFRPRGDCRGDLRVTIAMLSQKESVVQTTSIERRRNSHAASEISARHASTRGVCSLWPTDAMEYRPNAVMSQWSRENSRRPLCLRGEQRIVVWPEHGRPTMRCTVGASIPSLCVELLVSERDERIDEGCASRRNSRSRSS